jgi:Icc-related predicted phosphoesterase
MILLLGDIHGNAGILKEAIAVAKQAHATAIVQLGDFGLFPDTESWFRENTKNSHVPIYFIDGNHDDCQRWVECDTITQVWDDRNLFYIPRGTVTELDGRTIAVMGGASSINKAWLLRDGQHWDSNEDITDEQINRLLDNSKGKTIDIFLTHCPPHTVIQKNFDPLWKLYFEVSVDWTDPNQLIIEDLWHKLGTPNIYSGHMHKRIQGDDYRILNINELLAV